MSNYMFRLDGKRALITGATGGIGMAIANILHAAGASVVLTGTREAVLKQKVEEFGRNADYISGDMSDSNFSNDLFDMAESSFGDIDILICNAGITRDNLIIRLKDEDWRSVMDVNLDAVFRLNRAAAKKMMRRKDGRIINISSIVGVTGNPGQANYTAAKAALLGMSKSIAQEIATRNVTVNCIAPGFIESPMTDVLKDDSKDMLISKIPMARMGTPEEIAYGCLFLASKEASYITGQTLHINGGMYMG